MVRPSDYILMPPTVENYFLFIKKAVLQLWRKVLQSAGYHASLCTSGHPDRVSDTLNLTWDQHVRVRDRWGHTLESDVMVMKQESRKERLIHILCTVVVNYDRYLVLVDPPEQWRPAPSSSSTISLSTPTLADRGHSFAIPLIRLVTPSPTQIGAPFYHSSTSPASPYHLRELSTTCQHTEVFILLSTASDGLLGSDLSLSLFPSLSLSLSQGSSLGDFISS